jgi:hypothetical protein
MKNSLIAAAFTLATLSATALAATTLTANAQAPDRTRVGALTCDISAGIGVILGSKKEVACVFTPSAENAPREVYTGSITKFGLDIGATTGGEMAWAVFAPSSRAFGALAGDYIGGSAEATVGAGLGANVLVGGNNRTVALQPVSVTGQTGLNVAAGITGLELRPAR